MKKPRKKHDRKSNQPPKTAKPDPFANVQYLTPSQIVGVASSASAESIRASSKNLTLSNFIELRCRLTLDQYKAYLSMLLALGVDPPAYAYRLTVQPSNLDDAGTQLASEAGTSQARTKTLDSASDEPNMMPSIPKEYGWRPTLDIWETVRCTLIWVISVVAISCYLMALTQFSWRANQPLDRTQVGIYFMVACLAQISLQFIRFPGEHEKDYAGHRKFIVIVMLCMFPGILLMTLGEPLAEMRIVREIAFWLFIAGFFLHMKLFGSQLAIVFLGILAFMMSPFMICTFIYRLVKFRNYKVLIKDDGIESFHNTVGSWLVWSDLDSIKSIDGFLHLYGRNGVSERIAIPEFISDFEELRKLIEAKIAGRSNTNVGAERRK